MPSKNKSVVEGDLIPLLGALCFFFSTIEYIIPKPLPFLRLGLANLPLLIALDFFAFPQFMLLVVIKLLGQGLIGGTLFSHIFLFSLVGTLSSSLAMFALHRLGGKNLTYVGVSILGALVSNVVQLVLARFLIFGESAWLVAPPFIALGTVTSFLLGLAANWFSANSEWMAAVRSNTFALKNSSVTAPVAASGSVNPLIFFLGGVPLLLALLFAQNLVQILVLFVLICALVVLFKVRIKMMPLLIMTLSIVFFNLLSPFGKILWRLGGFNLTQGALLLGIKKALTIEGLILLSRLMIRPGLTLPGKLGILVAQSFQVLEKLSAARKAAGLAKSAKEPFLYKLLHTVDEILLGL